MGKFGIIEIDLAEHVFQPHGSAADGTVLFRHRLHRVKLLDFPAD